MNGFLNIHKPSGLTSHDVVAKVRQITGARKVGHTGTLDPSATGVLPVCIGKATKVARLLLETDKDYRVVMRLGETTDTEDATGTVLERNTVAFLTPEEILKTMEGFQGIQQQMAPMYSAVKVGGEPLYKAARQGRRVERPTRQIVIHRMNVLGIEGRDTATPHGPQDRIDVTFDVMCSKGTYIRTLCADMGKKLGAGGHLLRLERRRSGPFSIEDSLSLEEVNRYMSEGSLERKIIPIEAALADLPRLEVTSEASRRVLHGLPLGVRDIFSFPKEFKTGQGVLVYNNAGQLLALASALIDRKVLESFQGPSPVFKVNKVFA